MSERRAKGCLVAAVLWCLILLVLAVGYRFLVHPYLRERLKGDTSSSSQYQEELVVAADSFSGYAILRSDALRQSLRDQKIKLTIRDDQADYAARMRALRDGDVPLAVFTLDSLVTAGAKLGEFPGTIVMVIDETKGSDAIVAKQGAVGALQDLNDREARIVLTPNSPSEFLARVVIAHFNLPDLPNDWIVEADGAEAVYRAFRSASSGEKRAFVLWEPYVTRALEVPGAHLLLDSSRLRGYIVDVLVAQREFLRDHEEKVRLFVEAYLRASYGHLQGSENMAKLVREDARRTGAEDLDDEQATKIVQGIRWKNTLENYAHFGLLDAGADGGLQHLEDMLANIVDVLVRSRALASDPLDGQYHTLFYRQVLRDMQQAGFHPGKGLNVVPGLGPGLADSETVRSERESRALTDEQWARLRPVGELRMEPIVFVRGSARLSVSSGRDLNALAKRLESFPRFYVRVIGHTRTEGDAEANRILAKSRADAAAEYLRARGIAGARIRTEAAPSQARGGQGQAVAFVVGQLPY